MSIINQFNGLGGTTVTRESLIELRLKAIDEENEEIIFRIDNLLKNFPQALEFELEEIDEPAIEIVPNSFLYGLDYEQAKDELQGLGKSVSPTEVYDMITAKIIKMIEVANSREYKKTWEAKQYGTGYTIPFNFASKKRYRGINVLMLTELEPLENPFFLTFKQIKDLKGKVKKGAKGFEVVYFTKIWKTEDKPKNLKFSSYDKTKVENFATENKIENDLGVIPMLKYYHVYNGSDIEGIDFGLDKFKVGFIDLEKPADEANKMPIPEAILKNYPKPQPSLKFGGDRAFYSPGKDAIQMPYLSDFATVQDYYRTLLHEYSHSTGATKRLSRDFSGSQGSKKYAFEELVAELGAIFLSAEAGIVWHNNKNHAAYLKGWNSVLTQIKDDNKFIMKASTAAQKVADFVLQFDANGDPLYFEDLKKIEVKKPVEKPKKVASNYGKKTKRIAKPKSTQYPFSENDIPYETAYRAYTGISFSPEKRAVSEQKGYFNFMKSVYDENLIIATKNDKIDLFKTNFESFQKGYLKRSLDHLRSKHGIYSTMIAGGSKFPVARMEKLNRIANDKLNELVEFGDKGQKRLLQNITAEVDKPIKTGTTGALKVLQEKLIEAELIHKRNLEGNKLYKKIRSNKDATKQDLIDGLIAIGFNEEEAKKEAAYFLKYLYAAFFTTNSNAKVKRIKEQIALEEKLNTIKENTGNIEYSFDGGTVLLNYEDNKIQIFYTEKPTDEERTKLKQSGNAFKWSPFNKAWQRQLNTYPLRRIKELLPSIDLKSVKKSKETKELETKSTNLEKTKKVASKKPIIKKSSSSNNPVPFAIKPKSTAVQKAVSDIVELPKFKTISTQQAQILYKNFKDEKWDFDYQDFYLEKKIITDYEQSRMNKETLFHSYFDGTLSITEAGFELVTAIKNRLESLQNQNSNYALFEGLKLPIVENVETIFTDVPEENVLPGETIAEVEEKRIVSEVPSKYKTAADRERENQQPKQLYKIGGDLSKFLGKIEIKPVQSLAVTLDSEEGGGKTHTFYQWANEFYKAGYKTIIWSLEEHASSGLATDKSKKYFGNDWDKIVVESEISGEEKQQTYQRIVESIADFDVIFIDSWAKLVELNAKANFDQDFRKKFNGKLFFVIFQRTTSGEMRGGSKGAFDGDVILKVEVDRDDFRNNFIYNHKNRYNDYMPISELKYSPFHQALLTEEEELVFTDEVERI